MFDLKYKTDVLIVGSGLAGLTAAIEAKRKGANVLMVSKSRTGYASCSIHSGGGFTTPRGSLTEDKFFDMTVKAGENINDQDLVEILVGQANSRLNELEQYGVKMVLDDVTWPGRSFVPGAFPLTGFNFINKLTGFVNQVGIRTLENVLITSLLGEETISGVLGITSNNKTLCINSKAVILATGGAGQVYSMNDNPVQITGDGYVLALDLGLPLIDMEFIQFFPTGTCEKGYPKFMIALPIEVLQEGALRTASGENISVKYDLDPKRIYSDQRDVWARAIAKEIFTENKDEGSILLDMRPLSSNTLEVFKNNYYCKAFKNFPISERPIHITPLAHTFLGGIPIDKECKTGIPGLYAVGEITGGLHGANRVGGNALTECLVFGTRAGQYAAEYANLSTLITIDENGEYKNLMQTRKRFDKEPTEKGNPRKVKSLIQDVAWRKAGIIRSKQSLNQALESMKQIGEENIPYLYNSNPKELWHVFETLNLHVLTKLVAIAARERTESRGSHYREDYQMKKDRWLKHISIKRKKDTFIVGTAPVRFMRG